MIVTPDFDAEQHRYTYRGLPLVSVTQALRLAGLSTDPRFFAPGSAERGTAVHLATQYDDEGTLDESTLDPVIMPYVEAWRKFKVEMGFQPIHIERRLARIGHPSFAGTIDRVCMVGGFRWILDIKSGAEADADPLQLAGYSILIPSCRLANVYLADDGKYRYVRRKTSVDDHHDFIAAVRIAEWKIKNKKERDDNGHVLG